MQDYIQSHKWYLLISIPQLCNFSTENLMSKFKVSVLTLQHSVNFVVVSMSNSSVSSTDIKIRWNVYSRISDTRRGCFNSITHPQSLLISLSSISSVKISNLRKVVRDFPRTKNFTKLVSLVLRFCCDFRRKRINTITFNIIRLIRSCLFRSPLKVF